MRPPHHTTTTSTTTTKASLHELTSLVRSPINGGAILDRDNVLYEDLPRPIVTLLSTILIVLAIVGLVLVSVQLLSIGWIVVCTMGLLFGFVLMLLITRNLLIFVRGGRWITLRPSSRTEIEAMVCQYKDVVVVSQAWSFWLQYQPVPKCSMLLASNWEGIVTLRSSTVTVRSGTLFGPLTRYLKRYRRALHDRPMFDDLSVGGAVRSESHGFGKVWFMNCVRSLLVVRRGTGEWQQVSSNNVRFKEMASTADWIIVQVELETVADSIVRIEQTSSTQYTEAQHDAFEAAEYRMIFLNGSTVMVRVGTFYKGGDASVRIFQPGRWYLRMEAGCFHLCGVAEESTTYQRLSTIHTFLKMLWPFETLFIRLLNYTNIEFFAKVSMTSLPPLVNAIQSYHAVHGARTEVRYNSMQGEVALDVAFPGKWCAQQDPSLYIRMLYNAGVRTVRLHRGKFSPSSVTPLRLETSQKTFIGI